MAGKLTRWLSEMRTRRRERLELLRRTVKMFHMASIQPAQGDSLKSWNLKVDRTNGRHKLVSFLGSDNLPANTLLGIDKLALPEFMIEIEAMAVLT